MMVLISFLLISNNPQFTDILNKTRIISVSKGSLQFFGALTTDYQ